MKRYTIKCQVSSIRELTRITQKLMANGVKEEGIDYAFLSQSQEKGLQLKRRSNRGQIAQYPQEISYQEHKPEGKAGQDPHVMLAVNCSWDQRETVQSVLDSPVDVGVEDHRFQTEVGLT